LQKYYKNLGLKSRIARKFTSTFNLSNILTLEFVQKNIQFEMGHLFNKEVHGRCSDWIFLMLKKKVRKNFLILLLENSNKRILCCLTLEVDYSDSSFTLRKVGYDYMAIAVGHKQIILEKVGSKFKHAKSSSKNYWINSRKQEVISSQHSTCTRLANQQFACT